MASMLYGQNETDMNREQEFAANIGKGCPTWTMAFLRWPPAGRPPVVVS